MQNPQPKPYLSRGQGKPAMLNFAGGVIVASLIAGTGLLYAIVTTPPKDQARSAPISAQDQAVAAQLTALTEKIDQISKQKPSPSGSCLDNPLMDGCPANSHIRLGSLRCGTKIIPIAVDLAITHVRAALTTSYREDISPGMAIAVLLNKPTPVSFSPDHLMTPIDVFTIGQGGKLQQMAPNLTAESKTAIAFDPAIGIIAMKAGQLKQLAIDATCSFSPDDAAALLDQTQRPPALATNGPAASQPSGKPSASNGAAQTPVKSR